MAFLLASFEMTLLLFICACVQPSLSKWGEAGGGAASALESLGLRSALSAPQTPEKGTAVMNHRITLPHTDKHKQRFTCTHKRVFEDPEYTSSSLGLNAGRCDILTVRCLGGFLYSLFRRSAFCQWFCSPSLTAGGLRFGLKWLLGSV